MTLIRLLKKDLAKETTHWAAKKIISHEQAATICSLYGVDYYNQNKQSYGYFILTILGFLFIGLAVITIIGANWDNIPRFIRMLSLIVLTLFINGIGIYKASQHKDSTAIALFFLGGLLYGASIMLIAQIYHIGEHYPDGIFWWAAGTLIPALLMESSALILLTTVLSFIWFFIESSLNFYPTLFPFFLAALYWHCFYIKKNTVLFLTFISGTCLWIEYSFAWIIGDLQYFQVGIENVFIAISLFILLYVLSIFFSEKDETLFKDYGLLLHIWVLRFMVFTLLVFSFKQPWHEIFSNKWSSHQAAITIIIFLSLFSFWLIRYSQKKHIIVYTISAIHMLFVLTALYTDDESEYFSLFLQITDNFVLIIAGVFFIVYGIRHSITHYFFLGIIMILLTGLLRYIDLIGDYVGAAIIFIVFAIILLSAAYFWKLYSAKEKTLQALP